MGRFLPAEFDKGDANTIGGYAAVHSRPAAFEGSNGQAYSVEIVVDEVGDTEAPFGGYLLFVQWRTDDPVASGHLETEYLIRGRTEAEIRDTLGGMLLSDALRTLEDLIAARGRSEPESGKPWWDAMRDEPAE